MASVFRFQIEREKRQVCAGRFEKTSDCSFFCSSTSSNARSAFASATMAVVRTALEETAAARIAAGVSEWRTWGPGGGVMLPVGVLPDRTLLPLRFWTIEQWRQWAAERGGGEVKAEQEPLYYKKLYEGLMGYDFTLVRCSRKGCGRRAQVFGVMVRHYHRRQDLCCGCCINAALRGLLPPGTIPAGVPRRQWAAALCTQVAIMPAA